MSDQLKRFRSPNYPAISLREAVVKLGPLHSRIHKHAAPKEAIAKALGYGGWNGSSATVVSAFLKFGLLERGGDDNYKITARAISILYGHNSTEKVAALREAALAPTLYSDLHAAFPGEVPHDDILRPWLIRKGFGLNIVDGVIADYRETIGIAELASSSDPEQNQDPSEISEGAMTHAAPAPSTAQSLPPMMGATVSGQLAAPEGREERIMDDDGNSIVVRFPFEPTLETYDFLKDYLEFRIARLRRTSQAKISDDEAN